MVLPERLVCLVFDRSLGEGRGEGLELRDTLSEPTANIGLEVMSIPLEVEKVPWSLVSRDPLKARVDIINRSVVNTPFFMMICKLLPNSKLKSGK